MMTCRRDFGKNGLNDDGYGFTLAKFRTLKACWNFIMLFSAKRKVPLNLGREKLRFPVITLKVFLPSILRDEKSIIKKTNFIGLRHCCQYISLSLYGIKHATTPKHDIPFHTNLIQSIIVCEYIFPTPKSIGLIRTSAHKKGNIELRVAIPWCNQYQQAKFIYHPVERYEKNEKKNIVKKTAKCKCQKPTSSANCSFSITCQQKTSYLTLTRDKWKCIFFIVNEKKRGRKQHA